MGANIVKDFFAGDFFAGIRDIVGGRPAAYEQELMKARNIALKEIEEKAKSLGADGVIGVDLDYETIGSMLMVNVSGTAVKFEQEKAPRTLRGACSFFGNELRLRN